MNQRESSEKKLIVNLGCGKTRIPYSLGVDFSSIDGFVDIVHNLNSCPYPFGDDTVDEIHMYHVLEHLDNPLLKLEDIHRILKTGGLLYLRVPHFSSNGAFTDITHKRPFSYFSMDPLIEGAYHGWYTKKRFKLIKREIKYLGQYPNDGVYEKYIHPNKCPFMLRPVVRALNWMMNLNPYFFERFWCYWVGGACEVNFILKKI